MSITEEGVLTIAEVEVNDGFRVELRQYRKRTDYSPEQAEQLAADLMLAAEEARRGFDEHVSTVNARMRSEGLIGADLLEVVGGITGALGREAFDQRMRAGGMRVQETLNLRKDGQK
jgi:hypothetical protein